nr:TPA_asm: M112 uORF 1 RNA *1 [Murid betaherpesvirus 1]DBA07883.1 TPA_asm: M112 uORF 1 RNA *1 [Murid betaherpesvirus 1]
MHKLRMGVMQTL